MRQDQGNSDNMEAMRCIRYGKDYDFRRTSLPIPEPGKKQIQIRLHAATVASGDVVRAKMGGLLRSKSGILGQEFAGIVTAVGGEVTRFREGDRVFGIVSTGTHATYMTISEKAAVTTIPPAVSYEEAACYGFGANAALYFLQKRVSLQKGQQVLINGASGAVGSFAVQYAKYAGAEVTAACSTRNVERVRALGADYVMDYTKEDFRELSSTYDLVFQAAGHLPYRTVKPVLKKKGVYATTYLNGGLVIQSIQSRLFSSKRVLCGVTFPTLHDVQVVREMLEQGILKPLIDRTYSLDQLGEAFHYVEQGHKTGTVMISFPHGQSANPLLT
ncbi:NAD(P)-dependent alcohol dehydrogenase [Marinicrinis sediminis]|uniref:NAD(P)-dependent alcohol dehydrogenase n=1 Tax=Marinicrinis sediminis TaxID=1652465 RepID=A0ABW5RB19_9BACL